MNKKSVMSAQFALAFVWFTTHFGGGFASGRQVVNFFIDYGWYAVFTPLLSQVLLAITFYYVWKHALEYKVFDYRSWTDSFYGPTKKVMSNVYDVIYNLTLITATAIAFATGGATLKEVLGTSYILNTLIIAAIIFFLTIFGASIVRKAATGIAIAIIIGVLVIFIPNLIHFWPNMVKNVGMLNHGGAVKTGGITSAIWQSIVYAGFQASVLGAYISHASTLENKKEALKASLIGLLINGGIITLVSLGIIAFYAPGMSKITVPTLVVVNNGIGSSWMRPLVSLLIVIGSISTGVNLIFGIVNRISSWLSKNEDVNVAKSKESIRSIVISIIYIIFTWAIAQFGLIPLVAKGYGSIGYISVFAIMIPILVKWLIGFSKSEKNDIKNNMNS